MEKKHHKSLKENSLFLQFSTHVGWNVKVKLKAFKYVITYTEQETSGECAGEVVTAVQ